MLNSIQTKLTVAILIIFLLALSALGGLNYWKARDIITDNITNNMEKESVESAGNVSDWLAARKAELTVMSAAPVVRSGDPAAIVPFLVNVAKENKAYNLIGYAGPNGISYNSLGKSNDINDREYFRNTIKGEAGIFDPVLSKSTGVLAAVVAIPVKNGGKTIGVLYGSVDMAMINKMVLDIKVGQTGYAYVLQSDGLVIIHPDKELAMKTNLLADNSGFPPELKAASQRMVKGETGLIQSEWSGVKKMIAFAPVPGVKWSLAIAAPTAEITGAVSALTQISLITIVAVLVVAGLLIAWFSRRIAKPLQAAEAAANRIADGDISKVQLNITTNDEIGRLGHSFEQMAHNLRELVRKILGATEQVAASSQELTASSEQSALAANQIAASITGVAASASQQIEAVATTASIVEQMSVKIQQITANANQVAAQSSQAAEEAKDGDKAVEKVIAQMEKIEVTVTSSAHVVAKLGDRSKEIGQIVDTISGIAGQTNLLALNAAIEAARAGEQGRGFAVVAEEVRKLAEQSQAAAKKIAELIGEIQGDTDKAVIAMDTGTREVKTGAEVVNTAGTAFRKITGLVTAVSGQVREISVAMQQLASASQQIVGSIGTIDDFGKKSAGEAQSVSAAAEEQLASMEEIASSSQSLAKLAQDLQAAVNGFKL